jgi:hypothetical protein
MYVGKNKKIILNYEEEIIDLLVFLFEENGIFIKEEENYIKDKIRVIDEKNNKVIELKIGIDYNLLDIGKALGLFFEKNWENRKIFEEKEFKLLIKIYNTNKKVLKKRKIKENDYSKKNIEILINQEFKIFYKSKKKEIKTEKNKLKGIKKMLNI